FGLLEAPAGCLLGLVMPSAQRMQVALAGPAALVVRDGVIVVAADGRPSAAGEPTSRAADLDDVPQRIRWLVAGGFAPVRAGPGFDGGDLHRGVPGGRVGGVGRSLSVADDGWGSR